MGAQGLGQKVVLPLLVLLARDLAEGGRVDALFLRERQNDRARDLVAVQNAVDIAAVDAAAWQPSRREVPVTLSESSATGARLSVSPMWIS